MVALLFGITLLSLVKATFVLVNKVQNLTLLPLYAGGSVFNLSSPLVIGQPKILGHGT